MAASDLRDEQDQDLVKQKLQEQQEQTLRPFKEDLADWIGKHLGINITTDNFMDVLDNGVYVCKMAKLITQKAEECVMDGSYTNPLSSYKLQDCNEKAVSGSFYARDNTANFLTWCKAYGMVDGQMFETEYLVSHKNEKSVITCLLELARIGCKFGLESPSLIKMEKEMDKEEPEPPRICKPPKSLSAIDVRLDQEFLKNRHLMVRVGGGWNTLEDYLKTHIPTQVFTHQRPFSATHDDVGSEYLSFKSEYKYTKK